MASTSGSNDQAPIDDSGVNNDDDDDDDVITFNEILKAQEDYIADSAAVLGLASDKACSYPEGYMKRQALYSCLTCIPEAKTDASLAGGVCLACSLACHEGHDMIELYTKRNFRCDCGNDKFNGEKCILWTEKDAVNNLNQYNHNFSGVYCVCKRPFPDPDASVENDEMIQCILCEDWYHSRHLGTEIPDNIFTEMICASCVAANEFLLHYDSLAMNGSPAVDEADTPSHSRGNACKKPQRSPHAKYQTKFFDGIEWRKELCRCAECIAMYANAGMPWLVDVAEDPVYVYEQRGRARAEQMMEEQEQDLVNTVNSMNNVQKIELAHGYKELTTKLTEFLNKFAAEKKVVKVEHVKEFFDDLNRDNKRQKLNSGVPHYCR